MAITRARTIRAIETKPKPMTQPALKATWKASSRLFLRKGVILKGKMGFRVLSFKSGSDVGVDSDFHADPAGKDGGVASDDEGNDCVELDGALAEVDVDGEEDNDGHNYNVAG